MLIYLRSLLGGIIGLLWGFVLWFVFVTIALKFHLADKIPVLNTHYYYYHFRNLSAPGFVVMAIGFVVGFIRVWSRGRAAAPTISSEQAREY